MSLAALARSTYLRVQSTVKTEPAHFMVSATVLNNIHTAAASGSFVFGGTRPPPIDPKQGHTHLLRSRRRALARALFPPKKPGDVTPGASRDADGIAAARVLGFWRDEVSTARASKNDESGSSPTRMRSPPHSLGGRGSFNLQIGSAWCLLP